MTQACAPVRPRTLAVACVLSGWVGMASPTVAEPSVRPRVGTSRMTACSPRLRGAGSDASSPTC